MASASVPTHIKVGLVASYKNQSQFTLSSDENIEIGYFNDRGFNKQGQLSSSSVVIKAATNTFYDLGLVFNTYSSAKEAADLYGGTVVVAYTQGGQFGLYSLTNANGGSVATNASLVEVYDANASLLLVTVKKGDLVFRGYSIEAGMYLTKMGNGNWYRGAIGIAGDSGLTPYNVILLEEYLYGVVPKEMSASWPKEALKAQAVAARSIASYQYNRYLSSGYNVVDTTSTQAYGGYNAEKEATNRAVDETYGQVIRYNGDLAEAVYFSTSGGVTEAAKDVWGSDVPYLQAVKDIYEVQPAQAPWTRNISLADISTCLEKKGIHIGSITGVAITDRSASGRVKELVILGTADSYAVSKDAIRSFFSGTSEGSLKSNYFSFYAPVSSSNLGNTTGNSNIMVLSSSGIQSVGAGDLVAKSQVSTSFLPSNVAVQSATGVTYVNMQGVQQGNTSLGTESVTGNFTIYGAGYGHGVGMSQSGAKGMANAGFTYDEILKYYYKGVTVSQ